MRISAASVLVAVLLALAVRNLVGQSSSAQTWNLPHGTAVKDSGPRTYRFTVNYNTANTNGEVAYRQHVEGGYTRGLPNRDVAWKNVTVADAVGPTAAFSAGQKRDFMEFRYRNDVSSTLKPDFFKRGFVHSQVQDRAGLRRRRLLRITSAGQPEPKRWAGLRLTRDDIVSNFTEVRLRFGFMDEDLGREASASFLKSLIADLAAYVPSPRVYLGQK